MVIARGVMAALQVSTARYTGEAMPGVLVRVQPRYTLWRQPLKSHNKAMVFTS